MKISLIVATDEDGVIAKNGKRPWRMPADMLHFMRLTMGHPIIMGRKTFESIGRPLPRRYNIVITRNESYRAKVDVVVNSIEKAIDAAKIAEGSEEIFIIGGQDIFKNTLDIADRIYLTLIHAQTGGDRFFHYDPVEWVEVSRESHQKGETSRNQFDWDFIILDKR